VTPKLFQIIYNDATMAGRDTGFEVLDNRANQRPDWAEYWPIRQYFATNPIDDQQQYGFFSPRFFEKTGLRHSDLQPYLGGGEDVVAFSPYPDIATRFLNQLIQGEVSHAGFLDAFSPLLPNLIGDPPIQTVQTTIYCNYFVATGRFWRQWLALSGRFFDLAEQPQSRFGKLLREPTMHAGRVGAQMKVFCTERVAGWMLSKPGSPWRSVAPLAFDLPCVGYQFADAIADLRELDAIKGQALATGLHADYIERHRVAVEALLKRLRLKFGSATATRPS
jgi:hypothetical protein